MEEQDMEVKEQQTEDLQEEVQQVEQPEETPKGPSKFAAWKIKAKNFLTECWRVIRVTKKPTRDEYRTIVKVSGLGILIIGVIGFLIQLFSQLLK